MRKISSGITRAWKDPRTSHHGSQAGVRNFTALDGEGFTAKGKHCYQLFGIGQDQIEDSSGLGFTDVMQFLYDHRKEQTAFTGFYLGYDFSQWFSSLPEERAAMLLTERGRAIRRHRRPGLAPHPVEWRSWQFDILGMKRFKLRPKLCDCRIQSCKCPHEPWMYVCDAGPFFQSSLLSVIDPRQWPEPIVTPEEYAMVEAGKMRRAVARLDDESREYNRLENAILERVMGTLNKGFKEIGVSLPASKWFGPGQVAQASLKGKAPAIGEYLEIIPEWFLEAARASYFGGWFEIPVHGLIPGISHEYDINSAYPYIISRLPCLLHGDYTRGSGKPVTKAGDLCLVRARVQTRAYGEKREPDYIGAMLHRDQDGRISRPRITEGWFWLHELEAAKRAGCVNTVKLYEWCNYAPCDCPPPLADTAELYEMRLRVGKDTPLGKACKLVYNSRYGKFAQSVGEPIYGNPIYASLITAGCRTMILDAIATHPDGKKAVAMVATDGVYFLSPHPGLRLSKALGDWEHAEKENLTLFKPGVYWDDKARAAVAEGDTPAFKARGINAKDFAGQLSGVDAMFASWGIVTPSLSSGRWPSVKFTPSFSMVSALQALRRNDWSLAGHVESAPEPLEQNSNPQAKRATPWYDPDMGVHRTEPRWFGEGSGLYYNGKKTIIDVRSTPYEKRFGLDDPWSEESLSAHGLTMDGYTGEEFRFALGLGE